MIRNYKFYYNAGRFNKTLLESVTEFDNNDVEFYKHKFEYYDDLKPAERKSEAIFAKALDTLPVRVITDNELGALRAESKDTRGVVVTTRSVLWDTREAVRAKAAYKPPNKINPRTATIEIVRRGFADWRERAPKLLFTRDTCVNRISIEMSKCYRSAITTGVTHPASFANSSNTRVVWVCNC